MWNMATVKVILLAGAIFTMITATMVYQSQSLWLAAGLITVNIWLVGGLLAALMEDHHHDGLPK